MNKIVKDSIQATFVLLFCCSSAGAFLTKPKLSCPAKSAGETQADCPWAGITRAILDGEKEGRSATSILLTFTPGLIKDIKSDSKRRALLGLWGTSLNYDEFAKARIVEPAILKTLIRLFQGTVIEYVDEKQVVHAGLEHTYGYLFSNLKTPFGYKRARWVGGQIEEGFGLSPGTLGATPSEGTLFSNVTYFAGSIAFRHDNKTLAVLETEKKRGWQVSTSVANFDFNRLHPIRIEEKVEVPMVGEGVRTVTLRTDLIPFLKKISGNTHLLVYSILDPIQSGAELITAFPVQDDFVEKKLDRKNFGDAVTVSTQFNGFVPGLTGKPKNGSRSQIEGKSEK